MGVFSIYDIIKRAQGSAATLNSLLGAKIGDPAFKPKYDGPAPNERESSNLGSTLRKRDANGRWYFMPVVLVYKGKEYEMPNSLISIRGKKNIVSTPMVGRKGTVKELISMDDYEISIQGVALDTDWPDDQLAAIKDMRARGLRPLGNWHSHPETPSRPSAEDVRLAYDPGATYMILSLRSRIAPNLNAFRIREGRYEWEILELLK